MNQTMNPEGVIRVSDDTKVVEPGSLVILETEDGTRSGAYVVPMKYREYRIEVVGENTVLAHSTGRPPKAIFQAPPEYADLAVTSFIPGFPFSDRLIGTSVGCFVNLTQSNGTIKTFEITGIV